MARNQIYIYSFYRFIRLDDLKDIKSKIEKLSLNNMVLGTVLIANEGINGTISGTKNNLDEFIDNIKNTCKIRNLSLKVFKNQFIPFYRLKVRLKKEIVSLGINSVNPNKKTGKHVHPKDWDKLIMNEDIILIDARNNYEIDIGTFEQSINPKINFFREFPNFIKRTQIKKNKPVAMFCTGGIRCEKASSYLIDNGYKNVFQLDGGILNYLEYKKNKKLDRWNGECFVFDNRVTVNKKLDKGIYDQCHGCRHPITENEKKLRSYIKGVSCKYCFNLRSADQKKNSKTRQDQIDKAEKSNLDHPFKKRFN